ncbi:hypothetical protein [Brachybacterium tyrofermentans]|uniref:hypothetical protein n=1 Tax=Brachybacterium tyrofermentans TaxID=47848 RepID=UPI003FD40AB0
MSRRGRPPKTPPGTETGTRPPFAPGNTVNLRSGHRSPRVYGELAQHLTAGLLEDRPDLAVYPEAVAAWATLEAQTALLRRHAAEVGVIDPVTETPRESLLTLLPRLEKQAAAHRARLGLDPRAEAQLARERAAASVLAVDLDSLAQRGREALDAREQAGIEPATDPVLRVLERVQGEGEAAMRTSAEEHGATAPEEEQKR